jgi:hypothetical protein
MYRTISQKESDEFNEIVKKKSKELNTKEKIIEFFMSVGFCDKYGNPIYPYSNNKKWAVT